MNKYILILCFISVFINSCKTDDVLPSVTLSSSVFYISEDGGETEITATLSHVSDETVVVSLDTAGTAIGNGVDYLLSSVTIEIPSGTLTGSAFINAVQDDIVEGNDTLQVSVRSVNGAIPIDNQLNIIIEDDDAETPVAQLIINEVLYDPSNSGLEGDANGDGVYAQSEDEFIEFVNLSSQSMDVSGYKIYDEEGLTNGTPTHIFPEGTIISSGGCLVVFGGGTPTGTFGGAIVQTSTSGDLNMNNAGDIITVTNSNDEVILTFDITPYSDNPNESYTKSPDITGDYVQHHLANSALLFSPGTYVDGVTLFSPNEIPEVPIEIIINEVLYDPSNSGLDGDANGDGAYAQSEDEFIEFVNLSTKSADISGYKVYDTESLTTGTPTHVFPENTIIPAGGCLVLFGGGTPTGTFGGAIVQTSTSGDLNLNNAEDFITVTNLSDEVILTFDVTPLSDNPNESYTRSPDITGDFVQHSTTASGLLFSPGLYIDGVTTFKN